MMSIYLSLLKILYKALFSPCLVLQRLILRQLRVLDLLKVCPIVTGVAVVGVVDLVLLSFNFLEDNLKDDCCSERTPTSHHFQPTFPPLLMFLSCTL